MSFLAVNEVEVSYGTTKVLFGVDVEVDAGTIVALLGTNGAGKSTLLRAISGLLAIDAGTVVFDGSPISGLRPEEIVALGVVQMPGGKAVFPTLTVDENLRLAGWLLQRDDPYLTDTVDAVFDRFPVLRLRRAELAGNLSGGEQQMVGLGQALIARPRLLMIDELSLGLAPVVVEQLLDLVRQLRDAGTAIVLVEQSVNVALTLAETAYFLERGQIRFHGPTRDLLDRPDLLRAVFLEGEGPARTRRRRGAGRAEPNGDAPCATCGRPHHPVLEVRGLYVSFGGNHAVRGVDVTVREGEVVGIIGPNGAGKTTLFDAISGFVDTESGTVAVRGVDVTKDKPDARARAGLGRSFQDARLYPAMTAAETIAVACERHIKTRDPVAAALASAATKIAEKLVAEEVDRLLELLHLGRYRDTFVADLSTGTRRIVDLGCILAHRPAALLLDEPSSGLAQGETEALAPMIQEISRQTGAGLVVIEHDIPLVTAVADRLIAMVLGEIVVSGAPEAVVSDPVVIEAYLGSNTQVINRSGRATNRPRRTLALHASRETAP